MYVQLKVTALSALASPPATVRCSQAVLSSAAHGAQAQGFDCTSHMPRRLPRIDHPRPTRRPCMCHSTMMCASTPARSAATRVRAATHRPSTSHARRPCVIDAMMITHTRHQRHPSACRRDLGGRPAGAPRTRRMQAAHARAAPMQRTGTRAASSPIDEWGTTTISTSFHVSERGTRIA